MQSHYEINVSHNGRHFFATAERSCVDRDRAKAVYLSLVDKFPESEGFLVTVCHCQVANEYVNFK